MQKHNNPRHAEHIKTNPIHAKQKTLDMLKTQTKT